MTRHWRDAMALPIRIRAGDIEVEGRLNDSTYARAVAAALPWRGGFTVWGDQLTVPLPVVREPGRQATTRRVEVGDLGYWNDGQALCIFCGPTPMSPQEEPVVAEPVALVGSVEGAEALRAAKEVPEIVVEAVRRAPSERGD